MELVNKTEYADNFDGRLNEEIYQLSQSESLVIFTTMFGEIESSFYSFTENHWFVQADSQCVGRWIEAYNLDENSSVSLALKESVKWKEDADIYFCASRLIVFKTTWRNFVKNWDAFLACEDDCPILIQDLDQREAFMFTPMGEIRYIKKSAK